MYELVGFRYVDMKTDSGSLKGYSCFFLCREEQQGLEGAEAIKVFFSEEKFPDFIPHLDMRYDLRFSQKGRLIGWAKLDA